MLFRRVLITAVLFVAMLAPLGGGAPVSIARAQADWYAARDAYEMLGSPEVAGQIRAVLEGLRAAQA